MTYKLIIWLSLTVAKLSGQNKYLVSIFPKIFSHSSKLDKCTQIGGVLDRNSLPTYKQEEPPQTQEAAIIIVE